MTSNLFALRCAIVAALGGLLFGFDTAVISGTVESLENVFELNKWGKGIAVASALIGTVIGAIVVGKPADALGRRKVMFGLALLYFISAIGTALAPDIVTFIVFRFIGGLGVGGASVVAPMYIAEISPAKSRGRLVALAQFNIVLGILLAFASNYVISLIGSSVVSSGLPSGASAAEQADGLRRWLDAVGWRWMFGVEALPAAAYFFLLFLVPRSPRWLAARGRHDDARAVLARIHRDNPKVESELADIRDSIEHEQHSLNEPFFQRRYARPIMLAVAIAAFNQLSGINAILYYAPTIFDSAGFGERAGLLNSVGLGLMNLIFTAVGLALIDHFGRKKLMLIGSIGYIISLGAAAITFYTQSDFVTNDAGESVREFSAAGGWIVFASLLVFIASHAVGQGAVIWVFISEIFPNTVRARGQALGSFTHWIFAAAISLTFPLIADVAGGHVFAFYAVCMVVQLGWVLVLMPETKGVPLEQIQKRFESK